MPKEYNSNTIYETLEQEIVNLQIKPGDSLSENELCARFNVSRTPVRSVLQRLQENGFLTITPYKGTEVTLLDFDVINQLIYQRVAIESMVLRDFMKLCNPLLVEKMRYLVNRSRAVLDGSLTTTQFYELDSELHEVWFHETKKTYLWQSIQTAQCNYSRFRMLDIVEENGFEEILAEHDEMLHIIVNKQFDAVEPLLMRHLYGGVTRLGERIYTDLKEYFV